MKGKLKAHEDFVAELNANYPLLLGLQKAGADMAAEGHYAAETAAQTTAALQADWEALQAETADRGTKLREANGQQDFERGVAELEQWCEHMRQLLTNSDLGSDLAQAKSLLKRHEQIAAEFGANRKDVDEMNRNADSLIAAGNYQASSIAQRQKEVTEHYNALETPIAERGSALEASTRLQQFLRDAEDELEWIADRQARAQSKELSTGSGLTGALAALKTHQNFNTAITAHSPLVQGVRAFGQTLLDQGHAESELVQSKCAELEDKLTSLQFASQARLALLEDAERAERLYADVEEADQWIAEQQTAANSDDYGSEKSQTETLQSRHNDLVQAVTAHGTIVAELISRGAALVRADHFDSANIVLQTDELKQSQDDLQSGAVNREFRLKERLRLHDFNAAVDESLSWLEDKSAFVQQTETGKDQDECSALIKRVADTKDDVMVNEQERVLSLQQKGAQYVADGHADAPSISDQCTLLSEAWASLKSAFALRQKDLENALEAHAYTFRADDTAARMVAADAFFSSKDVGRDVASAQALVRAASNFMATMETLEGEVNDLKGLADDLCERLPKQSDEIDARDEQLQETWKLLEKKSRTRRHDLTSYLALYTFNSRLRYMADWLKNLDEKMRANASTADAAVAREAHADFKAELDARIPSFHALYSAGGEVIMRNLPETPAITADLDSLKAAAEDCQRAWEDIDHVRAPVFQRLPPLGICDVRPKAYCPTFLQDLLLQEDEERFIRHTEHAQAALEASQNLLLKGEVSVLPPGRSWRCLLSPVSSNFRRSPPAHPAPVSAEPHLHLIWPPSAFGTRVSTTLTQMF